MPGKIVSGLIANFLLIASSHAVTYQVTFNGTWNDSDVSSGYPASAHFSAMVGATHRASAAFWKDGGMASPGVEAVAELGTTTTLRNELTAAQQAGTGGAFIEFASLFGLPTSDTMQIEVELDKPYITLISMIAPSPDWFVGVSGLPLRENGKWIKNINVDLIPWDAGTEEGTGFSLSNPPSAPHSSIALLSGSPFIGMPTIATLKFSLVTPPPPPPPGPTSKFDAQAAIGMLLFE